MQALQTQVRNSLDWQTQSETSLWLTPQLTQGQEYSPGQDSVKQKQRLNKTQSRLNETVRNQRDDSMNQINQSKTSLDESVILKPKEAETEETKLDKMAET